MTKSLDIQHVSHEEL